MTSPKAEGTGRQGLRYLVVGAFNTVFGIASFLFWHATIGPTTGYMVVLVVAWACNILEAYFAYRLLVFRVVGQVWLDLARFSSVYSVAFAFNLVALPFCVGVLGLPVVGAQVMVFSVTVVVSFFSHRNFSFRRPDGAAGRQPDAPSGQGDGDATRPARP